MSCEGNNRDRLSIGKLKVIAGVEKGCEKKKDDVKKKKKQRNKENLIDLSGKKHTSGQRGGVMNTVWELRKKPGSWPRVD